MEFGTPILQPEHSSDNRAERFTNQYDELCRKIDDNPGLLNNEDVARQMEKLLNVLEGLGMDPTEEDPTLH